jgi:hypothetical protein
MKSQATITRGFTRRTHRDGRVGMEVHSSFTYGVRDSVSVSLTDDAGTNSDSRRKGAVKLEGFLSADMVSHLTQRLAGVSKIEGMLRDAIRMGVQQQRKDGNDDGKLSHFHTGEALALTTALRVIAGDGDIHGGFDADTKALNAAWAIEDGKQEARAMFDRSISAAFKAQQAEKEGGASNA